MARLRTAGGLAVSAPGAGSSGGVAPVRGVGLLCRMPWFRKMGEPTEGHAPASLHFPGLAAGCPDLRLGVRPLVHLAL